MGIETAILIAGAGIAAGGAYSAKQASKRQAYYQKEANQIQQRQADLQAARQRRDAVRQARMSQGAAKQTAVSQGAARTSAAVGGQGSIVSQANSGLSFLDTMGALSDQAGEALGKAAINATKYNRAIEMKNTGMALMSNSGAIAGGISKVSGVFKPT
jgi:hypothetical protein